MLPEFAFLCSRRATFLRRYPLPGQAPSGQRQPFTWTGLRPALEHKADGFVIREHFRPVNSFSRREYKGVIWICAQIIITTRCSTPGPSPPLLAGSWNQRWFKPCSVSSVRQPSTARAHDDRALHTGPRVCPARPCVWCSFQCHAVPWRGG